MDDTGKALRRLEKELNSGKSINKIEHELREDCWCEPETVYIDPETGNKVIVHREIH